MKGRKKSKTDKSGTKPEESKVHFDIFFDSKVKDGSLGYWQKKEILSFFQEQGLGKLEDKDKYEKILKLY